MYKLVGILELQFTLLVSEEDSIGKSSLTEIRKYPFPPR
jgi:hypothetical protein